MVIRYMAILVTTDNTELRRRHNAVFLLFLQPLRIPSPCAVAFRNRTDSCERGRGLCGEITSKSIHHKGTEVTQRTTEADLLGDS